MDDSKRRDSNASDKSEEGDTKRTNQFSFVERATQTMNNALKVKMGIMTGLESGLNYGESCRAATCRRNPHPGPTSVRQSTSGLSTTGKNCTKGLSHLNILILSYVAYETAKELAEEKETKKEQKEVGTVKISPIIIVHCSASEVYEKEATGGPQGELQ